MKLKKINKEMFVLSGSAIAGVMIMITFWHDPYLGPVMVSMGLMNLITMKIIKKQFID